MGGVLDGWIRESDASANLARERDGRAEQTRRDGIIQRGGHGCDRGVIGILLLWWTRYSSRNVLVRQGGQSINVVRSTVLRYLPIASQKMGLEGGRMGSPPLLADRAAATVSANQEMGSLMPIKAVAARPATQPLYD